MRSFFINLKYPAAIIDRAMNKAFSLHLLQNQVPPVIEFRLP